MLVANVPAAPAGPPQAPAKPPGGKVEFGDILIASVWLGGALILIAMVWKIVGVVRNYQDRKAATANSAQGQLSMHRKSFERGEMTEDEYDKIYKLLTGQQRKKGVSAEQPAPPGPQADGSGNGQV
jgi:hypothetical protein